MSENEDRLVRDLVERFPQLRPDYEAHLENNFSELLPYVLFWDFTQQVIASYRSGHPDQVAWRAMLEFLAERHAAGDHDVGMLIRTAFLDNLPYPDQPGHGIVDELPADFRGIFDWIRPSG